MKRFILGLAATAILAPQAAMAQINARTYGFTVINNTSREQCFARMHWERGSTRPYVTYSHWLARGWFCVKPHSTERFFEGSHHYANHTIHLHFSKVTPRKAKKTGSACVIRSKFRTEQYGRYVFQANKNSRPSRISSRTLKRALEYGSKAHVKGWKEKQQMNCKGVGIHANFYGFKLYSDFTINGV